MKRLAREKYYYLSPRYFTSSRIREFAFSRISTRSTPLLGVKNGGEGLKISPRAIFHHRVETRKGRGDESRNYNSRMKSWTGTVIKITINCKCFDPAGVEKHFRDRALWKGAIKPSLTFGDGIKSVPSNFPPYMFRPFTNFYRFISSPEFCNFLTKK